MKKIAALVLVGLFALGLTGCGQTDEEIGTSYLYEGSVKLKDGREVTCIKYAAYNKGGLSCDWEKK